MDGMSDSYRKGLWGALCSPSARYSVLTLLAGGFLAGIVFFGGFTTAMEATNTTEFCISCHELRGNFEEYKKTIHYANRSGVRASCSDCHVPKDFTHKALRKIEAANDVWGHLVGKIDTPEKFEANRLEMAKREWARMKATNSQACRNCHSFEGMDPDKQKQRSRKSHENAQKDKQTCIDCHKGIAHQKPKGMPEDDE
jgi:cytochrome c-type protein NapC